MINAKSWRRVLKIIKKSRKPVVVVSATDRTTRHLAAAAESAVTNLEEAKHTSAKIARSHKNLVNGFLEESGNDHIDDIRQRCINWIERCQSTLNEQLGVIHQQSEVSGSQNDAVLSLGEQLSAYLFAQCGKAVGMNMEWIDARSVIKTDSNFGSAQPDFQKISNNINEMKNSIEAGSIPVIGGFYGENNEGYVTTLGFEGSDYSASLIGAALQADAIEIWTDVSGIYTCDPRVVPNASPIEQLSFDDAERLGRCGAKVLHPSSVKPASKNKIPVTVKNIFEPELNGTKIDTSESSSVSCNAIAYIEDITLLNIKTASENIREHRLVEVFAILETYEPSTVGLKTAEESVKAVLKHDQQAEELEAKLSAITPVTKVENRGVISLIGCDTAEEAKLRKRVANAVHPEPELLIFSKKEGVLNIVMENENIVPAVKSLHQAFFE